MNARERVRGLCLAFAAAMIAGCPSLPDDKTPAPAGASHATIVDLERRFAAASRGRGAKVAFLEFLGEESIVLQPGPTWGRAAWTVAEDLPGTLDWQPDRAQIAADGDLGFASGPWMFAPKDPAGRPAEGRYVTVWQVTDEGWRVLFDGGFAHAPAGAWNSRVSQPALGPYSCEPGKALQPGELQLLDLAVSGVAGGESHARRILPLLDAGAALFHSPAVEGASDTAARAAALAALPVLLQYWPMGSGVSSSGDLGYSYGLSAPAQDASADASYVHIWCRHRDGWRLALQLRSKLPAR